LPVGFQQVPFSLVALQPGRVLLFSHVLRPSLPHRVHLWCS
jgi:hypothetical protein